VTFTRVPLPPGIHPEVLAADGDALLVGARRDGGPQAPALLRIGPDGTVAEVPASAATGYGRSASWYSLAAGGGRILGIGGDRGGAHGNVRWSAWTGDHANVAEHIQAFSTFGGWGAGDLVDGVLTPAGPVLVGSWQSDGAGMDVATWTAGGPDVTWTRLPSTGTPLGSTAADLGFPVHATAAGAGVLVTGWSFGTAGNGVQAPTVWRSTSGVIGWRRDVLPGDGKPGVAMAGSCAATGLSPAGITPTGGTATGGTATGATARGTCTVAGRVGGALALWRDEGGTWTRVPGTPPIPVGDDAVLPAPQPVPDGVVQVVPDGGAVRVVRVSGDAVTVTTADGPAGTVPAAAAVPSGLYLVAGTDPAAPTLWRTPAP
jgi:hypothetical protein